MAAADPNEGVDHHARAGWRAEDVHHAAAAVDHPAVVVHRGVGVDRHAPKVVGAGGAHAPLGAALHEVVVRCVAAVPQEEAGRRGAAMQYVQPARRNFLEDL